MILKMAFLNLFRHRARVLLSLLTIAGAIASTVIFRGYSHNILRKLRLYAAENQYGHVQIGSQKLWSPDSERIKDQLIDLSPEILSKLRTYPEVRSVAPRLPLHGLVTNGDVQFGAKIIGYDPEMEITFRESLNVIGGQHITDAKDLGILLGMGLNKKLKTKVGDSVSVVTQTVDGVVNAVDLTVRGLFLTTIADIDNQVAFVPINVAHGLLDTANVETWTIRFNNIDQTFAMRDRINEDLKPFKPNLVAKTWRDLADLYNRTEEFFGIQNFIVQSILAALTVLAILNTVGMTVYERTGEIGTLRSLGQMRHEVVQQFCVEGIFLASIAAVLGAIISILAASIINAAGFATALPGASVEVPIEIDLVGSAFAIAIAMGFAATLIGTIFPAWRASRLAIVDALRRNI